MSFDQQWNERFGDKRRSENMRAVPTSNWRNADAGEGLNIFTQETLPVANDSSADVKRT
jgi:hypothetical protein